MMLSDPLASAAGIASGEAPRSARRDGRIFPDERDVQDSEQRRAWKRPRLRRKQIPADVAGLRADLYDASSVGKLGLDQRSPAFRPRMVARPSSMSSSVSLIDIDLLCAETERDPGLPASGS